MIKVLYVGHSRKWRGGENQVRLLIEGLTQNHQDCECHIAYPEGAIAIERLKPYVKDILKLPSTRPYDPRSVLAIARYCKENKIQILNAQSGNAHTLAFYSKLFVPQIKLIVHRRVDNSIKSTWFTRTKYLSSKVDYWVAISTKIAHILASYGVNENKITTIYSSIDSTSYQVLNKQAAKQHYCNQFELDPEIPLIGFAAAMDNQKNPQMFVNVVAELISRGEKVNALMAGHGKLLSEIESQVEGLEISGNLKILGFIEDTELLFSAIDIFCLPSRNEGLGTVLLEAAHAECNVVASNVGGISEIIIDGQTGLLAEADLKQSFVEGIQQLIHEPEKAAILKRNLTRHVREKFSLSMMISQTHKLYKNLIQ